jgi:hypothetical protein
MEHHPVFAKGDQSPVAVGRNMSDGDEWHDDSTGESCMIRADSTVADARYRSVFPQGKQTDSPANWTP